jgi:hypothetical protein
MIVACREIEATRIERMPHDEFARVCVQRDVRIGQNDPIGIAKRSQTVIQHAALVEGMLVVIAAVGNHQFRAVLFDQLLRSDVFRRSHDDQLVKQLHVLRQVCSR